MPKSDTSRVRENWREISIECEPSHFSPVPVVIVGSPGRIDRVHVFQCKRVFKQWMATGHTGVQYANDGSVGGGGRHAITQLLNPLPLFVRVHVDKVRCDRLGLANLCHIIEDVD
jgi:hypothetical protein